MGLVVKVVSSTKGFLLRREMSSVMASLEDHNSDGFRCKKMLLFANLFKNVLQVKRSLFLYQTSDFSWNKFPLQDESGKK